MDGEYVSHCDLVDFSYRANCSSWETVELFGPSNTFAKNFNSVRAAGRLPLILMHKMKTRAADGVLTDEPIPMAPGLIRAIAEMLREASDPPPIDVDMPDLALEPELRQFEQSNDRPIEFGLRSLRELMLTGAAAAVHALNGDLTRLVRTMKAQGRLSKSAFAEWGEDQALIPESLTRGYQIAVAIRNALAHHGGCIDEMAQVELEKLGVKLDVGVRPPLNNLEARSLIEACMSYGIEKLVRTDKFLDIQLKNFQT